MRHFESSSGLMKRNSCGPSPGPFAVPTLSYFTGLSRWNDLRLPSEVVAQHPDQRLVLGEARLEAIEDIQQERIKCRVVSRRQTRQIGDAKAPPVITVEVENVFIRDGFDSGADLGSQRWNAMVHPTMGFVAQYHELHQHALLVEIVGGEDGQIAIGRQAGTVVPVFRIDKDRVPNRANQTLSGA